LTSHFRKKIFMTAHFNLNHPLSSPQRADATLAKTDDFDIAVGNAIALRDRLRGAKWSTQTLRLTTDVARILCNGGAVTLPATTIAAFMATLAMDGTRQPHDPNPASITAVILLIAAAAVIGYAINHPQTALDPQLRVNARQTGGGFRIWVLPASVRQPAKT
jgi:hypothetical protein